MVTRLREFMENEARSCSMDYGCITPLYVYRMWGGEVPLEQIEEAFEGLRSHRSHRSYRSISTDIG